MTKYFSAADGTSSAADPQLQDLDENKRLRVNVRTGCSGAGVTRVKRRFDGFMECLRGVGILLLMLVAGMALTACGDGGGSDSSPPASVAAPTGLSYPSPASGVVGSALKTLTPTVTGTVASYAVSPGLPAGLTLDASSGAISGTPSAPAPQASYAITATNAGGSDSFSLVLTISIAAVAPSISQQPANDAVTEGAMASFSVAATGTAPLSYKWSENGMPIASATAATYTIATAALSQTGHQFVCVVSNSVGSVTSNAATLTVTAATPVASNHFTYVLNANDNTISGYVVDPTTGSLSPTPNGPYPVTMANPTTITLHPSGLYAYVSTSTSSAGGIEVYSVDPSTGALTRLSGSPFGVGVIAIEISFAPGGKFLYAAGGGQISGFAIDDSGTLTALAGSPYLKGVFYGVNATDFVIPRFGQFGFFRGLNQALHEVKIDAQSGQLSEVVGSPLAGAYAQNPLVDPMGHFVFALSSGSTMDIVEYAIDPTSGSLTQLAGYPAVINNLRVGMTLHPNGKFLYFGEDQGVGNDVSQFIYGLALDATTGALTEIGGAPLQVDTNNTWLSLSASGDFGYAGGNLKPLATGAYVVTVNPNTGALTKGARFDAIANYELIQFDATGEYFYGLTGTLPELYVYSLGSATHVPMALSSSPVSTGQGPVAIASE